MKGKKTMKNKISGKIVALLLTLIIVATSGMPLYAKETGDKANSFRYENGQPIIESIPFADVFLVHGRKLQENIVVVMVL